MSETYKKLPAVTLSDEITEELPSGDKAVRVTGNINVVEADIASIAYVQNIVAVNAGTEYSFNFPNNVKRFMLKCKETDTKLEVGYASGGSYFTMPASTTYTEQSLLTNSVTIYFKANKSGKTIEIVYWI